MDEFSPEQIEERKRAVLDGMSERRRKHVLKKGYEKWDPFTEPKDPIDIRRDPTRRTTKMLVREFLQGCSFDDYSTPYARGVFEIAMGLINGDDRFRGMYDFSCWYQELLEKEKQKNQTGPASADGGTRL
jgi:hypothetical protein